MTDKEKLHQILSSLWKNDDSVGKTYYNQALQDVQTVIDSMQEEPTIPDIVDEHYWEMLGEEHVSEDLEEEIKRYLHEVYDRDSTVGDVARHFAEWKKQKDANLIFNAKEDGYRLGLATMKQQMMKEAVKVNISNTSIVSLPVNCNLKVGDKVLIIKEY